MNVPITSDLSGYVKFWEPKVDWLLAVLCVVAVVGIVIAVELVAVIVQLHSLSGRP